MTADASGVPFVLTARCDAFLQNVADPLAEAIARCQAYRAAGADCLFVPGPADAATLAALLEEVMAQHADSRREVAALAGAVEQLLTTIETDQRELDNLDAAA